jgi:hypothetical protein
MDVAIPTTTTSRWPIDGGKVGMSARKKLNRAYLNGSLIIAGLIGVTAGSWGVFFVAAGVLLLANVASGEIRPPRRR